MTDEELIARLRKYEDDLLSITADRIQAQAAEIERLRGDLKKTVETLEDIRRYTSCGYSGRKSLETLAELKGQNNE